MTPKILELTLGAVRSGADVTSLREGMAYGERARSHDQGTRDQPI
jgi:hypothetical protein